MTSQSGAPTPLGDHFSTDLDTMAKVFFRFGDVECKTIDSPLYARFSFGVANDPNLLRLASARIEGQPPPNILFAAVHYLLLEGVDHELREFYPALTENVRPPEDAFAVFQDFCQMHEERLRELISTRTVQTNVVRRSTALVPAFALVSALGGGLPPAQIEVGCSAGLNLLWDRYHFDYSHGLAWGDAASPVTLATERRGDLPVPDLTSLADPSWSRGVDLQPVSLSDENAVRWLRALVWPENTLLGEQLAAAIDVAKVAPPQVEQGDASLVLPALLEAAPADTTLCVFGTHTLYQYPRESLLRLLKSMQAYSTKRTVYFLNMESTGNAHSELRLTVYEHGGRSETTLANCHPHGYWLEWLAR